MPNPGATFDQPAGSSFEKEFAFSAGDFEFIAGLTYQKTGIVLAKHKREMVYGRLVRRLRALKMDSFSAYCNYLQSSNGEDEISQLINAITTNLTRFFREGHHFDHLHQIMHAVGTGGGTGRRIRVWSAACSSGMEAYSIAMTLKGAIANIEKRDVKVLATDIDSNMLRTGGAGVYSVEEYENIPEKYRQYTRCNEQDGKMEMDDSLKSLISFKHLNLLGDWPMRGLFDAVFCRNVVIYFDKPTKERLFDRLADLIVPDGWLYIGHSENLHNLSGRFVPEGRTIYRRIK